MERVMLHWMICEVGLPAIPGFERMANGICSWEFGDSYCWEYDLSYVGHDHSSSMRSDCDSVIPLFDMDACAPLHKAVWAKTVHFTTSWSSKPLLTASFSIIRILFMVPVYAAAAFLSFWYYWHAIYFQVISDCYEAFAIASFFALLCHYIAPDLHEQKMYFRSIQPKKWVLPVNWWASCCGGERGPWRTPRSGLTWFNIIWTGIYQYCFIRVTMTITAVVTQYFGKYCESSNSPVFAHIWVCSSNCLEGYG